MPETIWPEHTLRGDYDSDYDRVVCDECDWYTTGGPMGCAWSFVDHKTECHPR